MKTHHLVRIWGRDWKLATMPPGVVPSEEKPDGKGRYFWFRTENDAKNFLNATHHLMVVTQVSNNEDSLTRCVTKLEFAYQGRIWPYTYDFGYGYPDDDAEFMFHDGNYGCDCNRSIFLREHFKEFPEMECGDKIEMFEFQILRLP